MKITANFEHTDDMELTISATMRLSVWREIGEKLRSGQHYHPAHELWLAISDAVRLAEGQIKAKPPEAA